MKHRRRGAEIAYKSVTASGAATVAPSRGWGSIGRVRYLPRWWLAPLLAIGAAGCAIARPTLVPAVAFSSTRDDTTALIPFAASEIYFANEDMTNVRRLTRNAFYDAFPAISPDGKRVVFD